MRADSTVTIELHDGASGIVHASDAGHAGTDSSPDVFPLSPNQHHRLAASMSASAPENRLQNEHPINAAGIAADASISSHIGMVGVASVGYALPNSLRLDSKVICVTTRSSRHTISDFPPRPGAGA
jgi:hypothetical protein